MRRLDSFEWKPISGTEESGLPSFSPDGRWLAFMEGRNLYKVNLNGGAPIQLMETTGVLSGVSWENDGFIYGHNSGKFWRIPEAGGAQEVVYEMGDGRVGSVGSPFVLPGSRALVFHTGGEGTDLSQIHVLDLEKRKIKDLGLIGTNP